MKWLLIFLLPLALPLLSPAQECNCPAGDFDNDNRPFKVFRFNNGNQLGICGYQTVDGDDTTFTQFMLFQCPDGKVIKEWGENKTCKIEKVKDTVIINDIYTLPVGQSFSNIRLPFYSHKFYYRKGELKEVDAFRRNYGRYSKEQISQVLTEYNTLPAEAGQQTIRMANMLLCAYMSGSKEAEGYLVGMPKKFGPFDGVIEQEWDATFSTYQEWKSRNGK